MARIQSNSIEGAPTSVIAIDVGGTKIAGGIVVYPSDGGAPQVLCGIEEPTNAESGGADVLAHVVDVARKLAACCDDAPSGIGVGCAGCVDPFDGSIAFANELMPDWTGQPVAVAVSSALGIPSTVLGDVHAHALGEARWGAARRAESCLMVAVGTGIGGAYVLDGRVVRGYHGAAGHIGHTLSVEAAGVPCACGSKSHIESIASGTGIAALHRTSHPSSTLESSQIARGAAQGDAECRATLEAAGKALGETLGSTANLLDPELIVLSGSVCKAGEIWRNSVGLGFRCQALPVIADTPIVESCLGSDAALIGAAEQLLDSLEGCRS